MQLVSSPTSSCFGVPTLAQACLRSKRNNLIHPLHSETVMGRCSTNAVQLHDRLASRKHALILMIDAGFWLIDLGSLNGTYLNGKKVSTRTQLKAGDRINIGLEEFIFSPRA